MDRRHEIRLDAPAGLSVALPPVAGQFSVPDIGMGGLSIISSAPFARGSRHALRLTLGSITVDRSARTAHCHALPDGTWFVGLAFVGDEPAGNATIEDLLNTVLSSTISFL